MRYEDKRKLISSLIIILLLVIGTGYAFITSNLNIKGVAATKVNTWDIHFENIQVDSKSVSSTPPVINDAKDTITFSVILPEPGDYYIFDADVVNGGTLDAMVDIINSTELTEEQKKYFEYSITYEDDVKIQKYDLLTAGSKESIEVMLKYKDDMEPSEIPNKD